MGISAHQHRICVGLHNYLVVRQNSVSSGCHGVSRQMFYTVGSIYYFYVLLLMLLFCVDTESKLAYIDYSLSISHSAVPYKILKT